MDINDYGERCQFDAYCKLVLYHEAKLQRRREELSSSDANGDGQALRCRKVTDLHLMTCIFELVAEEVQEQSILILHFVLKSGG